MRSRMERYQTKETTNEETCRTSRNKDLYDNFYTTGKVADVSHLDSFQAVDLDSVHKNYRTRENYQRVKEYKELLTPRSAPRRKQEELSLFFDNDSDKVYDINSVLEQAKKNREKVDELETRRRLKNTQYNILANLDVDDIKSRKGKLNKTKEEQEEELQDLIHTITSKSLKQDVDNELEKSLLSDLMPTSANETVISEAMSKQILEKASEVPAKSSKTLNHTSQIDTSFYTKSMDLSEEDFEMDDEFGEDIDDRKGLIFKILLFVVLVIVITLAIFVIINSI